MLMLGDRISALELETIPLVDWTALCMNAIISTSLTLQQFFNCKIKFVWLEEHGKAEWMDK